ncbi:MAG: hypothetical protein SFV23_22225 [Planctomycetaceae bacterium]|nr:hypothetical protein [Planctomycetaceae bacterium]
MMGQARWFAAMIVCGLLSLGNLSQACAGVGGKTYNIVNVSNPLAPFRFVLPDQFESPLGSAFGGAPGTWSQIDLGLFALWTGAAEFEVDAPLAIPLTIVEEYKGLQLGPVLLALATLTFVENFETQRFFVIAIEATE